MLTAQEARKITDSYPQITIEEIQSNIKKMAELGSSFYYIDKKDITDESIATLKENGFIVDDNSNINYRISW